MGEGEAAYFEINFDKNKFFDRYNCYYYNDNINNNNNRNHNGTSGDNQSFTTLTSESSRTIKARIKSRIFLSTFRLIDGATFVELKFDTENFKLTIITSTPFNIKRKYSIRFEDIQQILQAEFESNPNNEPRLREICCQSNTFKRVLTNFANSLQEITLILSEQGLAIKSFLDPTDLMQSQDSIQTECHLKKHDHFTKFEIILPEQQKQIILTVVQKEFKAFLTLCEALDEPIKIYMTVGGAPIMLTNKTPQPILINDDNNNNNNNSGKGISLKLIMATISDEDQEITNPKPPNNNVRYSEHAALNARRMRREQQQQRESEAASSSSTHSTGTPLAQQPLSSISRSQSPSHSHSHSHSRQISRSSFSNFNERDGTSQQYAIHVDDDDDDVVIGMTHGGFNPVDNMSNFIPHQDALTTVVNETDLDNDHEQTQETSQKSNKSHVSIKRISQKSRSKESIQAAKKKKYNMFGAHPDSISPQPKQQELQNNKNRRSPFLNDNRNRNDRQRTVQSDTFDVNPPVFSPNPDNNHNNNHNVNNDNNNNNNNHNNDKYGQYDARSRQILPLSSSQSGNSAQRQRQRQRQERQREEEQREQQRREEERNAMNLMDDEQGVNQKENDNMFDYSKNNLNVSGMDSMELQFTLSDAEKHNINRNDSASDYLSSLLDHDEVDKSGSMSQTQRADISIAQRFEQERSTMNNNYNNKRRLQQDHYRNDGRAPKRSRHDNDNNNNNNKHKSNNRYRYVNTLRRKPKTKWQDSP